MSAQETPPEKPDHDIPPPGPSGSSGFTESDRRSRSWRHTRLAGRSLITWAILSVASLWVLNSIWTRLHIWSYTPHQFLYQNATLEEVSDLREVVRPLVDENQPFDVIATVWSRKPFARSGAPHSEDVLFSDVIFRGLTLTSTNVHAQVNLSIPLRVLEISSELENYDLRASFVLVPQSPSLLDGFVEYKSWFPYYFMTTVEMVPQGKIDMGERVREAVDSYGVTIPLIKFDSLDGDSAPSIPFTKKVSKFPIQSTRGRPSKESHPHVVTRTDLRVVKMTELYNAHWYDTYQQALETNDNLNGCIVPPITSTYDWAAALKPQDTRNCDRSFRMRANMETKIKVKIPKRDIQDRPGFAWTYAPFMDVVPGSWGPMDLVPMPVNRQNQIEDDSTKLKTLNVTWDVAFTASSPAQMLLAEAISDNMISVYGNLSSPYKKAQAQSRAQHIHWLHGHIFSDKAYIGQSLLVTTSHTIIQSIILPRLTINYWKSRRTTVGVSQVGMTIVTVGGLMSYFWDQYKFRKEGGFKNQDAAADYISLGFTGLTIYMGALMLANVLRLQRVQGFPFFKMREASRRERENLRVELQDLWPVYILFATISIQILASILDGVVVVPRLGPAPDGEPVTVQARILKDAKEFIPDMLPFLGEVYQLALNYRLKTFAGHYKSAAWLGLLSYCLCRMKWVPWIVGELPTRDPLTLADLVYSAHLVAMVVQAVIYPDVKQDVEEEHVD